MRADRTRRAVVTSLIAALLFAAGCSGSSRKQTGIPANAYPWKLRSPSVLQGDFMWRQKVVATFGKKRKMSFSAVLQKQGDNLTLLGLGPANSKAFVLKQSGKRVSFRSWMPRKLPFPPRFILIDIQRAFFPLEGVSAPGSRTLERDGERITEVLGNDGPVARTYVRLDNKPKGPLKVRYTASKAGNGARDVVIENTWFGYTLAIETVESTKL